MKTAIFLGAGASAAEGAPMQNALFRQYFGSPGVQKQSPMYHDLAQFFKSVFTIDLADPIDTITFPTFEEVLGILDLAETRKESLRGFSLDAPGPGVQLQSYANRVQLIRLDLILVMARAIADGIASRVLPTLPHRRLVDKLMEQHLINDTIFISTNYDLCIDSALGNNCDYAVDFAADSEPSLIGGQSVKLFKLHGSLNWLYCPVCNNVKGFESKVVLSLMYEGRPVNQCAFCNSVLSPIIVPPTFYKDMSRVFLSRIWNKTEDALREVDHVIFCGYSFPDADMHIKYLLKRMQTNRLDPKAVRFTLVNNHLDPPKEDAASKTERERYMRFLGENVADTEKSFEEFAENPQTFYEIGIAGHQ